ncbi:di-N-acetylchitobiase-like [Styela clava]
MMTNMRKYLGFLLIVCCFGGIESYNNRLMSCPCSVAKYCDRIDAPGRREVFGFGVNLTNYRSFNWTKLTTLVVYETELNKVGIDLVCLAHQHQTRVLVVAPISGEDLKNATARTEVVKYFHAFAEKNYLDGADIDVEINTLELALRNGLTDFAAELKYTFKATWPSSIVVVDVFWLPNIYHNTWGLADACDFLFIMAYDEQHDMLPPCVARANAPYAQTQAGVAAFRAIGIPGEKLVVGLPWYGYIYNCSNLTDQNLCYIEKDPNKKTHCTQSVGKELDYRVILKILPNSMSGRQWSDVYKSPFLNYKDNSTGIIQQIWFDDPESLSLKYSLADKFDLRGVGVWTVDALDYNPSDQVTAAMWNAVPSYK